MTFLLIAATVVYVVLAMILVIDFWRFEKEEDLKTGNKRIPSKRFRKNNQDD